MAGEAWSLGVDVAARPARAVDRMLDEREGALKQSAAILAAYMAVSALFYWLKPEGFPPPEGAAPAVMTGHSLWFWLKVELWTPPLTAVLVAMTAWFAQLLKDGRLPRRLPAAALCAAIPPLLLYVYNNSRFPGWLFGACWLGLGALSVPGFRRMPAAAWTPLWSVMMAVNALALALTPLFAVSVLVRQAVLYHSLEIVLLIWTLGVSTYGAARALGMAAARAFVAVFLGLLCQLTFVFSMYMLGLLPGDVLKALMAV